VWKPIVPVPAGIRALNGYTDTVPDIVGRLGVPIDLAIFTEGNHFPVLLGGEIIEPFRDWARAQQRHAAPVLDNIVIVTLPQPMIVGMLLGRVCVWQHDAQGQPGSGFYPDIVMGGASPLARLRWAAIVDGEARVFARNRGLSLLVAAGNRLAIRRLWDIDLILLGIAIVAVAATRFVRTGQLLDDEETHFVGGVRAVAFVGDGRRSVNHLYSCFC